MAKKKRYGKEFKRERQRGQNYSQVIDKQFCNRFVVPRLHLGTRSPGW